MEQSDENLFVVLGKAVERRLGKFNAQHLANTAWAFATVGQEDARLFMAWAKVAERRMPEFDVQGLANTAWAIATLGQ